MNSDVATVAVLNWLVARDDLDATVVTNLLDVLRDDREELIRVNAMAEQIRLDALGEAPIPLHDAARGWLESSPEQP
jgi:TRAP-type uncharacterized transport system substrate-binding protein